MCLVVLHGLATIDGKNKINVEVFSHPRIPLSSRVRCTQSPPKQTSHGIEDNMSYQLVQVLCGPDCVPISLVINIDGRFIKHGIPVKPIYCMQYIICIYCTYQLYVFHNPVHKLLVSHRSTAGYRSGVPFQTKTGDSR